MFGWAVLNLGRGDITYGMLSMLISLEGYIQGPVNAIASSLPDFVRMLIAADRLEELIDMGDGEAEREGDVPAGSALALSVQRLRFSYPGRETPVLRDFSCLIPRGSFTVIRGESGCGKTTLLHLILGILTPGAGHVALIDAVGRQFPAGRSARRRMGYVPQGNTLFSGTILDNVCFGLPADEQKARRALTLADALAFVDALPQGLGSLVNENSRGLSVGQAQRVAIARALYGDPAVLILDEATSALDRETEKRILTAIHQMPDRPTVLCVTHRDGALSFADQILSLN